MISISGFFRQFSDKTFRDAFSVMAASFVDAISKVAIVFVLTRYYDKTEFGLWSTITSIGAIAVTGDFGIINALRNKISKLIADGDDNTLIQKYFFSSFYFFLLLAIIFTALFIISLGFISYDELFNTTDQILRQTGLKILVFIQILFFFNIPFSIANPLFYSYQESSISALFILLRALSLFVFIILFSLCELSIVHISCFYFTINTIFSFIQTIYFIIRHKWYRFRVNVRTIFRLNIELIKTGFKFMILQFSSGFLQNIGTILAGACLGLTLAADYNIYTKLFSFAIVIFQSFLNPIWGSCANAVYSRQYVWLRSIFFRLKSIITVSFILMTIILCIFGNWILELLAGNEYKASVYILAVMGMSSMFYMLFDSSTIIPKASNHIGVLIVVSLVNCALIIPITKLLIPSIGLIGIPVITGLFWILSFIVMNRNSNIIIKSIKNI